jgi:serine/threonine protein phosphatase PrpC
MANRLRETLPEGYTPELAGEALSGAIGGISDKLFEQKNADGRINFGAALCALLLVDRCAVIVNLGDCRCYWLGREAETVARLTTDHNIAADMVAAGILSPEAARKSAYSARLTRFAGMPAPAVPGIAFKRLSEGDRLALCSDGLYGEVEEADIAAAMQSGLAPHEFCETMIAHAKEHGGRDNISLIMISL